MSIRETALRNGEFERHKPIRLSPGALAVIEIFKRRDDMLHLSWAIDEDEYSEHDLGERWDEAATEFVDHLQGEWCIGFIKALRDKLQALIDVHEKRVREIDETGTDERLQRDEESH